MSLLTRSTTRSILGLTAAAAGGAVILLGPASSATTLAPSTVTIQAQGTDLSGTLSSTNQSCVDGRKVLVIKQIGTRGGGDDIKFASDTAGSDGSWSTGNTGTEGKFYAKVRKTDFCQRDTSPTITASR